MNHFYRNIRRIFSLFILSILNGRPMHNAMINPVYGLSELHNFLIIKSTQIKLTDTVCVFHQITYFKIEQHDY